MFSSLRKEFGAVLGNLRPGEPRRTITVAKPYCTPARDLITATCAQYGVKIFGYKEQVRMLSPRAAIRNYMHQHNGHEQLMKALEPLPIAQVAKVTVSEKQAAWAEYILLRTGKLYVPGAYVNRRNEQWAAAHGGVMPPAWKDNGPWIESTCSEGMQAWAPLRKAAKKGRK